MTLVLFICTDQYSLVYSLRLLSKNIISIIINATPTQTPISATLKIG
ncbi:hypothetical protein MGSAQ_000999 [marine sediment metagenome]|uniref:Uncharacterized protein n=1 Tax=marine sediment metagenome TaxID=412755 RepID=A0A1B6NVN3_9ZZZZ